MNAEEFGRDFVRVALGIDQHLPGYVEKYYGPPEIAEAAQAEGKPAIEDLRSLAASLLHAAAAEPIFDAARREYLVGELEAMQTTLRILQGESFGIVDEVRRLYGVTPAWIDESTFLEVHRDLEALLPGATPLAERYQAFRENMYVPVEVALEVIGRLSDELRERTWGRFRLPQDERCEFTLVQDKPWAAYNWYLGGNKSRVEINTDRSIQVGQLPYMIAHEAYAGHHTEHAIKEAGLYRAQGRLEHSILLCNAPSLLVSEGLAQNALDVLAEPVDIIRMYEAVLERSGYPKDEAKRLYEVVLAALKLAGVSDNELLMLHRDGATEDEVVAYGMRYALTTDALERQVMKFRKDPLWRSYGYNYTIGSDLVQQYLLRAADRRTAFARLLEEPMTPAQLAA